LTLIIDQSERCRFSLEDNIKRVVYICRTRKRELADLDYERVQKKKLDISVVKTGFGIKVCHSESLSFFSVPE
jgi:hypothetical protein